LKLSIFTVIITFLIWTSANVFAQNSTENKIKKEIEAAIEEIKNDIETQNIEGLQSIHLLSDKFSKFGPRNFNRQDVDSTNASEANFFSSISDVSYNVRDLKIDVFDHVVVATYYPEASFILNGERRNTRGRQTFVFLKSGDKWKLVHEHGTGRPQ